MNTEIYFNTLQNDLCGAFVDDIVWKTIMDYELHYLDNRIRKRHKNDNVLWANKLKRSRTFKMGRILLLSHDIQLIKAYEPALDRYVSVAELSYHAKAVFMRHGYMGSHPLRKHLKRVAKSIGYECY